MTGTFFQTTQPISGNVGITGTPNVNAACSGDFYPDVQPISGSVSITGTPTVSANISNSSIAVTGTFFQTTQPISGSVSITGTPAVTTTIDNATSSIQIYGINASNKTAIKTDANGKLEVVGEFSSVIDAATSSILMVGDDYSGADPAVQNPIYVDADGLITANVIENKHEDIVYGFDEMATSLTTGSNALWQKINPFSSDENGWFISNPNSANNFGNLFWYNNGGYGNQQAFNFQSEFPFSDIDIWFMIMKNYRPLTGDAGSVIMPTIRIYSKNTGSGDEVPGFYKSYWDYTINAGQSINFGESIMIYTGLLSRVKLLHTDLRRVGYSLTGGVGTRGNSEIVNHIAFIYNTPNLYNTLVIEAGIYIKQKGLLNYYFSNGYKTKAEIATIAMNTTTSTISTNVSSINTKLTGMTYTSNRLQTGSSIVDSTGATTATISTPTTIGPASTIRSLDTRALVGARDVTNDLYDNLTMANSVNGANELYKALDVYERNPVLNNKTTNDYSVSGLNVYPIFTKKIYYPVAGKSTSASANRIFGGPSCTAAFDAFSFGKANPKTWQGVLDGSTPKTIIYDYVNALGNLVPDATATLTTTASQIGPTNGIISINRFRFLVSFGTSDVLYLIPGSSTKSNSMAGGSFSETLNGVITVPNGYVGYLTSINVYNNTAAYICVFKWDINGIRSTPYTYFNNTNANITSGFNGNLGFFTAGESFALGHANAAGGANSYGTFVLEAI